MSPAIVSSVSSVKRRNRPTTTGRDPSSRRVFFAVIVPARDAMGVDGEQGLRRRDHAATAARAPDSTTARLPGSLRNFQMKPSTMKWCTLIVATITAYAFVPLQPIAM